MFSISAEIFSLVGKVALEGGDKVNDEINKVTDNAEKKSSKFGSVMAGIAKAGAIAVGAMATAVAGLAKQSLDSYAEYEQLVGGVETLFKDSADVVQAYADEAYKTAGLSANEYMSTVTSFSASLISSLDGDTAKASEMANQAIIDMSDNANKMGSSMESIQNAYAGFAKQNYTMLDNLKLGYGGTKEEMERLLKDAQAISGVQYDVSSYADVVSAIHVIQEEMDIAGTTAKEASITIEGSINSMKSAWKNLVTGLGNENADLKGLIDQFVDSFVTAGQNVLPRLNQILVGIGDLIVGLVPLMSEWLQTFISDVLPSLLESGMKLVGGLSEGILNNLPTLIQVAVQTLMTFVDTILADPDSLVQTAIEIITTVATALIEALPQILSAGLELIVALVGALINNLPKIVEAGGKILKAIVEGIKELFGDLVEIGGQVVDKIKEGIANAWEGIKTWFQSLWASLFGGLKVNVSASGLSGSTSGTNGSHRAGMEYVPYDNYVAQLHQGEMVLTSAEAEAYRLSANNGTGDNSEILMEILQELKDQRKVGISINNREFGRLVKGVS